MKNQSISLVSVNLHQIYEVTPAIMEPRIYLDNHRQHDTHIKRFCEHSAMHFDRFRCRHSKVVFISLRTLKALDVSAAYNWFVAICAYEPPTQFTSFQK